MLKKSWRKRLGLAVLAIAVVGPPLAFGLSNLFFMTPKGRSFVAARIQRTIQLETTLQGLTWTHGAIKNPTVMTSQTTLPQVIFKFGWFCFSEYGEYRSQNK